LAPTAVRPLLFHTPATLGAPRLKELPIMKVILAIIRMNRMNETKAALVEAGVASMTARKVVGRGHGKVDYQLISAAAQGVEEAINQLSPGPRLIPKRLLSIIVPDDMVPIVVKLIITANQTGNPGDGKIFVLPVLDAVRIRTAETGDTAINENAREAIHANV
jgi:nitrogen regulatory protein PII 2